MAVKSFDEATLKNQFAMKVEQKNEGFLQKQSIFLYKLPFLRW